MKEGGKDPVSASYVTGKDMRRLTVREGLGEAVSHGEAGCASASDDEVIAATELGDLASNHAMRQSTRQGCERADEEGIQERHIFLRSSEADR